MKIEQSIRSKLVEQFQPVHFELTNESHLHHRNPNGETHFKILLVSDRFQNLSRIDRQRMVQALLEPERSLGLHAVTLQTLTQQEWDLKTPSTILESPTCATSTKKAP